MCVPRVPSRPGCVNHGRKRTATKHSGSDGPEDRPSTRRERRRQSQEASTASIAAERWEAFIAGVAAGTGAPATVYSLELGSSHTGRRIRPRCAGLILSERQRERCRRMLEAAGSCGTSYGAFRRFIPGEGVTWTEERLVCQLRCGTRACPDCDREIRLRECARVEGPYRQFVTLGVPSSGLSIRQAWYRIRRARALLFKRLERHAARPDSWAVRVWTDDATAARDHRARTSHGRKRVSEIDYAWVLEPHKSGYPHLHFVINTAYLDYRWLRETWSKCIGRTVRWCKVKPITCENGISRYLSKYLSKTVFTADLCAVMYRQRMWATSRPLQKRQNKGWIQEAETTCESARADAVDVEAMPADAGFVRTGGRMGRYATWRRTWTLDSDWAAWLMADETQRRYDPELQPKRERGPAPPNHSAEAAIWDFLLERAYNVLTNRVPLTSRDSAGQAFASESSTGGRVGVMRPGAERYGDNNNSVHL